MISTNRNSSNREGGEEIELEPLNPPAPTETENRATDVTAPGLALPAGLLNLLNEGPEEKIAGVSAVSERRDGVRLGKEAVGILSCFIFHMLTSGETLK